VLEVCLFTEKKEKLMQGFQQELNKKGKKLTRFLYIIKSSKNHRFPHPWVTLRLADRGANTRMYLLDAQEHTS